MEITAFLHTVQALLLSLFTLIGPQQLGPNLGPGASPQALEQSLGKWAKDKKLTVEFMTQTNPADPGQTLKGMVCKIDKDGPVDLVVLGYFTDGKLETMGYMGRVDGPGLGDLQVLLHKAVGVQEKKESGFGLFEVQWQWTRGAQLGSITLLSEFQGRPMETDGTVVYPNGMFQAYLFALKPGKKAPLLWGGSMDELKAQSKEFRQIWEGK